MLNFQYFFRCTLGIDEICRQELDLQLSKKLHIPFSLVENESEFPVYDTFSQVDRLWQQ
jgi:hypothetical protein